jgi:L-ascorbate metabolism protein UlaG (beta-lactamase superfamily)
MAANPWLKIVCPEANRAFVADRVNVKPHLLRGLDDGTSVRIGPLEFHGVPAAHNTVERDAQGRCKFLGYVIRMGDWTIYHSGDTVRYEGMADRLKAWPIDLALLPINGDRPERRVAGNLNGVEAARLARDINARSVIPCHYDMFEFNTASPDEFARECESLGQPHRILRAGEKWSVE